MTSQGEMPRAHSAFVHPARQLPVISGANLGDPIGAEGASEPGDVYRLRPDARALRLRLTRRPDGSQAVAEGSDLGRAGAKVRPVAQMTLMGQFIGAIPQAQGAAA